MSCNNGAKKCGNALEVACGIPSDALNSDKSAANDKFMDARYPVFQTDCNAMPGVLIVPPNRVNDFNRYHPYALVKRTEFDGVNGWEAETTRSTSPTISSPSDSIFIPDDEVALLPKYQPKMNMKVRVSESDETISGWASYYKERGFDSGYLFKRAVKAWARATVSNDEDAKRWLWEEWRNCIAIYRELENTEPGL